MIKFGTRRNLKYPALLVLFNGLRALERHLTVSLFEYDYKRYTIFLMFLGELLGGLIYYIKEYKYFTNNKKENLILFGNIKYYKKKESTPMKTKIKILFLIFISSYFDFFQFLFSESHIKYVNKSITLEKRFRGILTIYTALFSRCFLNLNIYSHHRISIYVILICLVSLIISEIALQKYDFFLPGINLLYVTIVLFFAHFYNAIEYIIEKQLLEYNQINPYLLLIFQGIFGIFISIIYYLFYPPFDEIIKFYNKKSPIEFIMLIITFIIYIILSGGKNIFRILTTKIFNPMTTTFMDYIFNPIFIIVSFSFFGDFTIDEKRNWINFGINLFISLIISFFGGVYTEFIILFCCGLDRETHRQITYRSNMDSNIKKLYDDNEDDINSMSNDFPDIIELKKINIKANELEE